MSTEARKCSQCRDALRSYRVEPNTTQFKRSLHHHTWDSFLAAVKTSCAICSTVWELIEQNAHSSLEHTPHANIGTFWCWYSPDSRAHFAKFSISCRDLKHTSTMFFDERFRIIPCNEGDIQAIHDLSTAKHESLEPKSLHLAFQWYSECIKSHPRCCIPTSRPNSKWTPTRLIYIGSAGDVEWKLCHPGNMPGFNSCYMTLSYRWRLTKNFVLEMSKLDDFSCGLPISCLPRTFQDAIHVAHRFSVQYLWIDALCIVQDSPSDWAYEATTMCDVYSHSACNIAATASPNEHGGLFGEKEMDPRRPHSNDELRAYSEKPYYFVLDKNYWNRQLLTGPLHRRGWVFQECLLAPRVVYFAGNQVLWECCAASSCEEFPNGVPCHFSAKNFDPLWAEIGHVSKTQRVQDDYKMPVGVAALWDDLVEKYAGCDLTKASDKLVAFSGIVKLFRDTTEDDYIAGLWKSRLVEQMNWMVHEPRSRPTCDRAPSWSWAAVDGPVIQVGLVSGSTSLVSIRNAKAEFDDKHKMNNAYLELVGSLYAYQSHSEIAYYPDCLQVGSEEAGSSLFYLPLQAINSRVSSAPDNPVVEITGIVLKRSISEPKAVFRREGFFSTVSVQAIQSLDFHLSYCSAVKQKDMAQLGTVIIV